MQLSIPGNIVGLGTGSARVGVTANAARVRQVPLRLLDRRNPPEPRLSSVV